MLGAEIKVLSIEPGQKGPHKTGPRWEVRAPGQSALEGTIPPGGGGDARAQHQHPGHPGWHQSVTRAGRDRVRDWGHFQCCALYSAQGSSLSRPHGSVKFKG